MADGSKIQWTDATLIVDRGGRRTRVYQRQYPSRPGQQIRRKMAAQGMKWCRRCSIWLDAEQVGKNGLCRPHENETYRKMYAVAPEAIRARATQRRLIRLDRRKLLRDDLFELFGGLCAYCPAPATTVDHIIPVSADGPTAPGNLVPACLPCNSSKRDRDVYAWLEGRDVHPQFIETLSLFEAL